MSYTPSSTTANIWLKKVYLRQPVGKSQLRKTDTRKLLPFHKLFAVCMSDQNAVYGTICNCSSNTVVLELGGRNFLVWHCWKPCKIVHLPATEWHGWTGEYKGKTDPRSPPCLRAEVRVKQHAGWWTSFFPRWENRKMWAGNQKKRSLKEKMTVEEAAL